MESERTETPEAADKKMEPAKIYVYTIRDWKEYVGESILIIFSVLLALILIRDIYHGWAVDRTDLLLQRIETAIKKIEAY